ncbi:Rab-GTPase-TBC [Gracilaria domingensis]|nr:Rab-GTPase-TBC [Gracilaria domingensis]
MPLALRVHMQQQQQQQQQQQPSSAAYRSPPPPPPPLDADLHTREFHVLLDADAAVDETKLRRAASSGVPPHMRQRVWKLLLGVSSFDTADDLALHLNRTHSYNAYSAAIDPDDYIPSRIRRVLKRSRTAYQPLSRHDHRVRHGSSSGESYDGDDDDEDSVDAHRPSTPVSSSRNFPLPSSTYGKTTQRKRHQAVDREVQSKFIRVITTYLETAPADVQFHDDMVYLCAPFIEIMPTEADAFHAFTVLMRTCQHLYTEQGLKEAVADFNLMFRDMHPILYDKFVVEEVDMNRFVCQWLRGLLVHQLPRRCLLRLWDSYFANLAKDALALHPFVCLVFIELLDQELEECDDSERILSVLGKLPATDIDHVIAHAHTARERLREKGIV